MWRALFLALGINAILLGGEFLVVERFELSPTAQKIAKKVTKKPSLAQSSNNPLFQNSSYQLASQNLATPKAYFQPKDWMPWSLMAAGAVIVIYTGSFSKRQSNQQHED